MVVVVVGGLWWRVVGGGGWVGCGAEGGRGFSGMGGCVVVGDDRVAGWLGFPGRVGGEGGGTAILISAGGSFTIYILLWC